MVGDSKLWEACRQIVASLRLNESVEICVQFSSDKSINNLWHIVQMTIERSRKW